MPLSIRDLALIFITVFIWGTNFVAIRWGLDELPPFFFTAFRFSLVALPAIFLVPKPKTEWWKVVLLGCFVALGQFSLLFLAMALGLKAGLASLIMQAQVVFTIILSFFIFGERVSALQILGIVIAFAGFSLFFLDQSPLAAPIVPILVALAAAFSWACGNQVYKVVGDANRFHLTIWSSLVPIVPMFVASFFWEGGSLDLVLNLSFKGWASVLFTAYLSTILAYSLWGILLGKFPSAIIVPFALTIPIFGFLSAWALLGERLSGVEMLASVVILVGLFITVMAKRLRRLAIFAGL